MDIAITICLVGGVICGVLANAKRRSFLGWLVIGMLFPVIGIILIVVLPSTGFDASYAGVGLAPEHGQYERMSATMVAQRTHMQTATLDAIDRLVQLKDRGELSEFEFDEKRAELLARI